MSEIKLQLIRWYAREPQKVKRVLATSVFSFASFISTLVLLVFGFNFYTTSFSAVTYGVSYSVYKAFIDWLEKNTPVLLRRLHYKIKFLKYRKFGNLID